MPNSCVGRRESNSHPFKAIWLNSLTLPTLLSNECSKSMRRIAEISPVWMELNASATLGCQNQSSEKLCHVFQVCVCYSGNSRYSNNFPIIYRTLYHQLQCGCISIDLIKAVDKMFEDRSSYMCMKRSPRLYKLLQVCIYIYV